MEYEVRRISDGELEPFSRSLAATFGFDYKPVFLEERRKIFEFDRNIATFDQKAIVGTAGIFTFTMVVPGGARLGCGGVTMVTVRPSHRRQGVLTAMMRRLLDNIRERGEPLAALWASEASIDGRFGYGIAIQSMELKLPREWSQLKFGVPARGRVRLVETAEARERMPAFWEAAGRDQPGWMSRTAQWWETRIFLDPQDWRDGMTANSYALYEEDGELQGMARYRVKQEWKDGLPCGRLVVQELAAPSAAAYSGLWRFLAGVDLMGTIEWENASTDEALYWMLADSRRLRRTPGDAIWVRLVDIEAALGGRRYMGEGRVVFEVSDPFLAWCAGRYELEAGPEGAICRRTTATADIALGAEELGAIYLGGASLATLARAGRAEGEAKALARADALFGWGRVPHCAEHF